MAGHDVRREPDAVRAAIGVTGQFAAVDNLLTGEENLRLMADLLRLGRASRAAGARASCWSASSSRMPAGRQASTYSGGMRRRLDIAMTLMGDPRVIFLDEPTTGLDPRSRHATWEIVRGLVAGGVTVLLTTQYLEEADQLAGRIAVLDHGRVIAEGTPEALKRRIPGGHIRLRFAEPEAMTAAAERLGDAVRDDAALTLQLPSDGSVAVLRGVLARLDRVPVEELSVHTPDLDDVFLTLTGKDFR